MNTPKTVLITGGTSGIGYQTALGLAALKYQVFICGRDENACKQVIDELKKISPQIEHGYFLADMANQSEIKKMASEIITKLPHLDVLINNAGCVNSGRIHTAEGFERTFAVNHMAYFLLTQLLWDLLIKSAPARIVNVASDSHYQGKLNFDNLQGEKSYFIMQQYANTKLMNVLFTKELAKRLDGTGVTANCLHPGVVKTKIGNKTPNPAIGAVWGIFAMIRGISAEQGAQTSVFLANSDEVKNVSGKYFENSKAKDPSNTAMNAENALKLWEVSESLIIK